MAPKYSHRAFLILFLSALTLTPLLSYTADDYAGPRQAMIEAIRETVRETRAYIGKDELDPRVLAVMAKVPRHEFVPTTLRGLAYLNRPLPIGSGQTISQPYIVALMTDLARVDEGSKVLEIGTGSGYQAAILAELAQHVYTIEIIEELGRNAEQTLERLGYRNVTVRIGDGYLGWPEAAPFDAIIVTAAPPRIPQTLIDQLAVGGRLVVPIGQPDRTQTLTLVEKTADGRLHKRDVLPVGFVPMVEGEERQ
jgi:protein-L-isoaspartate(D-aspartate) O-methyltransferase